MFAGVLSYSGVLEALEVVPYYNYQFTQGVSVSPEGNTGYMLNLSNDIGTIIKPFDNHAFIAFYGLNYQGPGLKEQEGRAFRERYMNHMFVGRHNWTLGDMLLSNQVSLLLERRRSGTNETWESGLYNFNRIGGTSSLSLELIGIPSTISLGYHFLEFPNYTDLLAELRGGADASDTSGTQNHHSIRLAYNGRIGKNSFWFSLNPMLYTRQKIAVEDVQSDGTYYSSDKQRELSMTAGYRRDERFTEAFSISPSVSLTLRTSNQNYQHFEDVTSTVPVQGGFYEKFFNYIEPSISIPLYLRFTPTWTYFINPSVSYRGYTNRPPRDSEGEFLEGEQQHRLLNIVTTGFRKQTGESSSTVFFFTWQNQSSNMEFERYATYNYNGFSGGIRFQMEY